MSEQNIEIVRRIYEAWASGESARDYIDEDLEYVNPDDAVESGTLRGRKSLNRVSDVYSKYVVEPERFIDAGDDVVVVARGRARGAASGLETSFRQGYIWTIRDGRAIRFRWFSEPRQALEAAGLPAEPPS